MIKHTLAQCPTTRRASTIIVSHLAAAKAPVSTKALVGTKATVGTKALVGTKVLVAAKATVAAKAPAAELLLTKFEGVLSMVRERSSWCEREGE